MKVAKVMNPAMQAVAVVGVSLALGLVFNWLFFGHVPGLSVIVYIAAIVAGLLGLARLWGRSVSRSVWWLLPPLGLFAAMVAVRASDALTMLNVLACLFLLLLIARLTLFGRLQSLQLLDYAQVPFLPFKFLAPLGRNLAACFTLGAAVSKHRLAAQIVRGIVLALPVLVVFLVLFASADLVFQKYATAVIDLHLSPTTIVRTILVAGVTLAFTGAYAYIFGSAPHKPSDATSGAGHLRLGGVESSILLGSVNVVFLLFILVQLAYLFGGQSNITAQGFTYADYARRGFFELLAAAMVTLGLLWVTDKTATKAASGHRLAFRLLSGALIGQVLVIMLSAFKRLYLYEQAFGFTTLRLYSHGFVVFLAVIFGLLLWKILKNQPENRFAGPAFVTALVFLAALNGLNPDAFIARQNLARFHHTGKLDAAYMGGLSADARAEVKTAISVTTGPTQQQLTDALARQTAPSDWQSWNLARQAGR